MEAKKLIIIGAGVAGLSAGVYARLNGYEVEIYEKHDKPGGMCTSWKRQDYTFDYCIHNLIGTSPGVAISRIWRDLGALDGVEVINHSEFVRIENTAGQTLHWYIDLERLEKHLKELAPEDTAAIAELIGAARKLVGVDLFSMQLGGILRTLKVLPSVATVKRWSQITVGQFAQRLNNPFLRRALLHIMYDIPGESVPMTALILFMAGLQAGDLGWPRGGSLNFSRNIEKRYLALGGRIHYRSRVEKINIANGRATGIRLADGREAQADRIISAADGYNTLYGMLEARYLSRPIESYYGSVGETSPFGFIIFLGLKGEDPEIPHATTLLLDHPIDLGEIEQDSLHVVACGPDSGLVPPGKQILKIEVQASYPYWKTRRDADPATYREAKVQLAGEIIKQLVPRFPGLRERIEIMDTSTPPTAERFTGNRFGWQAGPAKEYVNEIQKNGLSYTLPGLEGFYHIGQWAFANLGVSSVAISGHNLVRELCKKDHIPFVTQRVK